MKHRELILTELGLTPIWRRRNTAGQITPTTSPTPDNNNPLEVVMPRPTPPTAVNTDRVTAIMQMDWAALKNSVASCTACKLHKTRTNTVFGVGDEQADWLFVGEAPGAEEDKQGKPFVGQAGKLLDNMLAAIGLSREKNVYIANVLKSRPPDNRNPEPDEVVQCEPYLKRQIELLQPKIIVTLGRFAALTLLNTDTTISSLRGKVHRYHGVPLIVTYHPAYLLRSLTDKAKAWQDLCLAMDTIQKNEK